MPTNAYEISDVRLKKEDIQLCIQDGTIVNYVLLDDLKPLRKKMNF